ncbi:hypothetical protein [Noviherbaspirillum pedocola]|uniref:Uncharacterized protein n=1 Tax=Noviherbaspirillum pedocola TaxID=2801341 RepID=A0A934SUD3_9BURK|nr:hypothetical protein [Noviherbaspirillum pedocola]MBK4735877.1 hypothetical protein [Noviherbaspirillum pedocola]
MIRVAAQPTNREGLRLPPLTNVDITLRQFMTMPYVQKDGRTMTLGAVIFAQFCRNRVRTVIEEMFLVCSEEDLVGHAVAAYTGAPLSLEELRQQLDQAAVRQQIDHVLMAELEQAWCSRTLRSFFMTQPNAQGYLAWWPDAKIGDGIPLSAAPIAMPSGTVVNSITRCFQHEADTVAAYEWCAELRIDAASDRPDAIAYGMLYAFERDASGCPLGTVDDLICASDAVSDVDVLQVDAMLAQHGDTPELIVGSDLAFVWLWERALDSERGLGAQCLKAALADLAARFPELHTVAINMKPAQFKSWEEGEDPPAITMAKQEAIDALHGYIGNLRLDDLVNGEVRMIVANKDPDPERATQLVAQAAARRLIRQVGRP